MVIMITAYGREVLADARDHSAPPFVDFLTKPVTPKQLADSVLHALHGEQGAWPTRRRAWWSAPSEVGVRLLVGGQRALNRRVAAELLEQRGRPGGLADGGLAGVQQVLEASVAVDAVLMDMQMGYRWSRGDLENPRRRALRRAADPAMTANASLADREAAWRRQTTMWRKPIDKASARCFACSVISAGAVPGAPATAADAGELVEARGRRRAFSGGSLELIVQCCGASFRICRTFAQLERQLGEGDVQGSAATLHTIKGSASTVGASALAGRASELEQALRRADSCAACGNPRRHPPRRTAHPGRDACLFRLQAMFGDVQAESAS